MAELLIVISVIGILAAISIPIFIEQKDRAIVAVTRANLEAMRSALSQYAAQNTHNRYPVGNLHYHAFRALLPEANLPPMESDAKILSGSFAYSSDGLSYLLRSASTNRTNAALTATPAGTAAR